MKKLPVGWVIVSFCASLLLWPSIKAGLETTGNIQTTTTVIQQGGAVTNEVLVAGSGVTMTRANGTNTVASAVEYVNVTLNTEQNFPYPASTKILYTNGIVEAAGTALGYDTNNSLIRVYRTGKYAIYQDVNLQDSAAPNAGAHGASQVFTNGAALPWGYTIWVPNSYTMRGQSFIPVVSLASNSTIEGYAVNGNNHTTVTNSPVSTGYPTWINVKYLGD